MKTFLTLLLLVLSNVHISSQELIRWDFETQNGTPTLSPTFISDSVALDVNPVVYSNLYPLSGNPVTGTSGQPFDWANSVRGWYPDSSANVYSNTWTEFRFFVHLGFTAAVDSVSLWGKTEDIGPKRFDFRSHKDLYGSQLDAILLGDLDTSWFKWSVPLNLFVANGYEQVTFRIYGDGAPSEYEGFFAIDSVAIYGTISPAQPLHIRAYLAGSDRKSVV